VIFWGKESQTFMISMYSTTVLYDSWSQLTAVLEYWDFIRFCVKTLASEQKCRDDCKFQKWFDKCQINWIVDLPATEQCCFINYNSYTGESRCVHAIFIELTYVRLRKEMGGNVANWSAFGWWKGTSLDEATLNSEEIKAIALAVMELCLSEGIG